MSNSLELMGELIVRSPSSYPVTHQHDLKDDVLVDYAVIQMVGLLSTPKRGSEESVLTKQTSSLSNVSAASLDSLCFGLDSPGAADRHNSVGGAGPGGRRQSFGVSKFAMDKAAQGGHLKVLKLLHDQVTFGKCTAQHTRDVLRRGDYQPVSL